MGGGGKETFAMTDVTPNEARMPEDAAVTVTNADTLRAMASPIRMRILGTLRVNGEQTVGSISEQLGEAPGAISYHLGQLARVGLVEKVRSPDGDRRKKLVEGLPNRRSSGELRRKEQCRQGKGHGSVSAFGGTFLRDGLRAFSGQAAGIASGMGRFMHQRRSCSEPDRRGNVFND